MKIFLAALWVEALKVYRSKVPWLAALGFSAVPLIGGLFMVILKDPEGARSMGLIGAKAQLTAGVADWPTYFNLIAQAVSIGGAILFSLVTGWVFGREFSDQTAKELLALPTPREAIISAKIAIIASWAFVVSVFVFGFGLLIGRLVVIPGWSADLQRSALVDILGAAGLTILLMPYVALAASLGRGYLPAFGWTILVVALAQIAVVTGWGDWFPWAIPALFGGAGGPRADVLGVHSYVILGVASLFGLIAILLWWRYADQTR